MSQSDVSPGEALNLVLLNSALSTPWNFLRPNQKLRTGILDTAKSFLDPLANSVSDSQTNRQRKNRKRKRSGDEDDVTNVLQLKELYVDGFSSDQIWEQALRIFDSADQEIERDFTSWLQNIQGSTNDILEKPVYNLSEDESGLECDFVSELEVSTNGSSVDDLDDEELDSDAEVAESGSEEELLEESEADENVGNGDTYVEDRFGLNDGFFSIDDFNKQTELFERQDARGDLDDESDADEVDWHTDPLGAGASSFPPQRKADKSDDGLSESDEEGPTFDNIGVAVSDLHLEEEEEDSPADGLGAGFTNTSDVMYADFFAPPPRKASKKRSRLLPKTQPTEISENDIDRAMADVRRDLFDDEEPMEDSENEPDTPENSRTNRSTHEKQRSRIADEIRRLEAANVAKKEWMLSGEARAVERPMNSLIEQDLDFERIGKPVPVVTTELSESIEELVKRRIIAKEFDEVIRRRPGLPDRQNTQRARLELEDGKPQQSLAELYEADHLRATDSNFVDPKNQKLLKEHTEINNLWRDITSQLDTLCNWHYKPKTPQAAISVVTDVASITMEDAQPTASGAVRSSAALAPQEIYAPNENTREPGEVVMRSGVPITKEEMSREEKARLRRRQKKQDQTSIEPSKQRSGKAAEKRQIVSDLQKGGVKVIGRGGDMMNLDGSKATEKRDRGGAHAMKL
ncbi:U3 small nucleolar ribonucleoprotein complex, subunit Mpp10 [Aspergillus heterothallicus]